MVPRAVDPEDIIVQSSNQDPHSLLIKFPLEYGRDLNYKDGRPGRYAIGVVQDDSSCETQCSKMMSGIDPYSRPVEDSVRRPVTYTHKHLKPETDYCVGVNVAARIGRWRPDMWRCVKATTGKVGNESEVGTSVAVGLTVLFLLLVVAGFVWCRKRYRRHEKKFEDAESFLPKPPESKTGSGGKTTEAPSLPPRNGIQGTDNPMFRADSALIPVSVKEESESNSRVSSEVDPADQSTDQGHFEQAPVTRYGHNPAFTSSDPTLGLHQGDPSTVQDDNNAGDRDDDGDDNSHDNSDEEGDSNGGSSDDEEDDEGNGEDTDCRLLRYHEYGSPSRSSEGSSEPTEETAQVSNTCRYSALATQPPRYSSRGQGHTPIRENSDDDEEGSADDGTDSEEDEAADSGSAPGFGTTRGASIPKTPAPLCRLAAEIPQTPAAGDRNSVPTDLTTGLDLAAILQAAEASSASPKPQEREPSQDVPAPSGEMIRPAASAPSSSSSSSLSSPTSSSEEGMELSAILQVASLCSTPASRPSGEVTAGASQDREEVSGQGDAALMGGCATADCSDRAEDALQDDVSASVPPATLQMVQKDVVPAGRFSFSEAVEPCSAENRAVSASAAKRYQRLGRPSVGHNLVTGQAGRTNPPSNSLQLEDILTAAKHCPWKSPDMAVHNGRTPRARPNRHSACLESGIDSESARDTDMESISPTDASLDTVLLLAQSTIDSEASDLCPLSPISSAASRYAGPRPHKISSQWSRDSGTCSHGHSGEVNGETSPLSPVECLRYNPLCNSDCGDGESFHKPLQYEAQKHISPPMETCTKL